jgi:large subunit ribosomal protein L24
MVKVISGREKGKTGKVLRVDSVECRVWIERLGLVKRHQKPTRLHRQGGIIEKEAPIHLSNVMYYDEKSGKTSRIGYRLEKNAKVRYAKRTGETLTLTSK